MKTPLTVDLTEDFVQVVDATGGCLLCADKSDAAIIFLEEAVRLMNQPAVPFDGHHECVTPQDTTPPELKAVLGHALSKQTPK